VATISKVHFEVMEQPNPNRVAITDIMECRCNGPLLAMFRESRQALMKITKSHYINTTYANPELVFRFH
jgi:hypothetical protein